MHKMLFYRDQEMSPEVLHLLAYLCVLWKVVAECILYL